jgi:hypothetical protein
MLTTMLLKLFFNRWSVSRQANFMKRRGVVLGTRQKDGRQSYVYMVNNLFAEIFYEDDNPSLTVETVIVIYGMSKLQRHLEKDIRNFGQ